RWRWRGPRTPARPALAAPCTWEGTAPALLTSERHAIAHGDRERRSIRAIARAGVRLRGRRRARSGVGEFTAPGLTAVGILPTASAEEIRLRGARLRLAPRRRPRGA